MIEYPTDDSFVEFVAIGDSLKVTAENAYGHCYFFVLPKERKIETIGSSGPGELLYLDWEQAEELRDLLNEVLAEIKKD